MLTGQVEQLQFRNQQLEQQLRRAQEDTTSVPSRAAIRPVRPRAAARRPRNRAAADAGASATERPAAGGAADLSAAQAYPPAAPQGAPQPDIYNGPSPISPLRPADAAATCSIRTRIRMRRARRVRSVSSRPASPPRRSSRRSCSEEAVGARGGREAGAPLDLSTLRARAALASRRRHRSRAGPISLPSTPGAAVAEGAIRSRLLLHPAQGLRLRRRKPCAISCAAIRTTA